MDDGRARARPPRRGSTIFPTHRIVARLGGDARCTRRLDARPATTRRARSSLYRARRYERVEGDGRARRELGRRARARGRRATRRTRTRRSPPSTAARPRRRSSLRPTTIEEVLESPPRGEVMPQKSTFFYPEAHLGPALLPAVTRLARALPRRRRGRAGRARRAADARRARAGRRAGEGGDDTTAIDAAAEDAILARFAPRRLTIVSEEVGALRQRRRRRASSSTRSTAR